MEIAEEEFSIPFFKDNGFKRFKCSNCSTYFWTQQSDPKNCGDTPCQPYTFIGNPPTKAQYPLDEIRRRFLDYFKKHDHTVISPYPVVARWRDDVYLVGASIFNFQPYVTEGLIAPPANPLVVSQPAIRLTDLDLVGPTNGRHLTMFEMGGAHAFNFPDKQVYWKDETIRLHHDLLTRELLGVHSQEVTYKEHFWSGGGNAGPAVEACVGGLEVSTLVFMQYKVQNDQCIALPIKTVDTGYGIERWTWLSQGTPSGFHSIYPTFIDDIAESADLKVDHNLLAASTTLSSQLDLETTQHRVEARKMLAQNYDMDWGDLDRILTAVEEIYAIIDHTKTLAFVLSEGVIPSNVEEGYLARLLARRTIRMLRKLHLDDEILLTITDKQIQYWGQEFPQLVKMKEEILDALNVETEKYHRTIQRGIVTLEKMTQHLTDQKIASIPTDMLIQLYDSHGLDPDTVQELAQNVKVSPPDDFYSQVAQRHLTTTKPEESPELQQLKRDVETIPPTKMLYYDDVEMTCSTSKVLKVLEQGYVILDQTCFYPEGGGQVADYGNLKQDTKIYPVVDVQKVNNVILHKVEGAPPKPGTYVEGEIDWDRRVSLMRHHTATHILIGAARRLLGDHAWQTGAQKDVSKSRLDITHHRHLTLDEVNRLEEMARDVIAQNIPVDALWMPKEEAEKQYGYRIYQGGVVPGKKLRIIKVGDWDVEACGGTHCARTGQVGVLKILGVEHPQDGVERLIFSTGSQALTYIQDTYKLVGELSAILEVPPDKLPQAVTKLIEREKELDKKLTRFIRESSAEKAEVLLQKMVPIDAIKLVVEELTEVSEEEATEISDQLIKRDSSAVVVLAFQRGKTARILVSVGEKACTQGLHAGEIAETLSSYIRGGGGGKPYFGQAGGTNPAGIREAIAQTRKVIEEMMKR